jgi:hypothetical protein
LVKVRITTFNQDDEAVQIFIANLVVPRRPAIEQPITLQQRESVLNAPAM